MDALTAYKIYNADPARSKETVANRPQISREVEYYQANIRDVKSIDDLMADQRLYGFIMQSYGLEDMAYAKAFMRKILEGGSDDPQALANRLTDNRYLELATDFDFNRYGGATTTFTRIQSGVVDKYYQNQLEHEAGAQNNGARLAMYFQRKSSEISDAYSILSDAALLKFTQTSFGLPESMSFASLEKQAEMINQRLDVSQLQNTEFVDDLMDRFLVSWDMANVSEISVPPLISSPSGVTNISQNLLASLQNLKF